MSETNRQRAREFLFEWIGVDHRNDCRGSSIDQHTGHGVAHDGDLRMPM